MRKNGPEFDPRSIAGARRAALPAAIVPQFPTLVTAVPSGDGWLHEIKYDGYRIIGRRARDGIQLLTRHRKDWTVRFSAIGAALAALTPAETIFDGEVVHQDPDGTTSFAALARDLSEGRTEQLVYYVFDMLYLDGFCLTAARLEDRKRALARILPPEAAGSVRYSRHMDGPGSKFFAECCRRGFEGVVSKRRDAPYTSGHGRDWLKTKCVAREEFVIIGWTDPHGSREGIGSLLLGFYDRAGKLHYAGRVGTGFSAGILRDLRRRLEKLSIAAPPDAAVGAAASRQSHWVRPALVAEVRFTEWTSERRLRHPVFLGLREDKTGRGVVIDPPTRIVSP